MLMEMNVFQALGEVLGLYSNIAIAWVMAVVADLVINKPLGLSPQGIEFKRAHLYDINPVGVGAMALASLLSITAHLGLYGELARAFSAVIAMTHGVRGGAADCLGHEGALLHCAPLGRASGRRGLYKRHATQRCVICERELRRPGHGALPGLPGADLLAVLHARRALRRSVQAPCQPVGAVVGRAALAAAAPHLALPGQRAGPLSAADAGHRAAAGHACSACCTARKSASALAELAASPRRPCVRAF